MQLDLYLGFTSCQGNCIFCRKGKDLVHFQRSASDSNQGSYLFREFFSENGAWEWVQNEFPKLTSNIGKINISGNDPIDWSELSRFMEILKRFQPNALFTLRLSNTIEIQNRDILNSFDKFECSLYADNEPLHNAIIGNQSAWSILHKNLSILSESGLWDRVFFQTIPIRENLHSLQSLMLYLTEKLKTKNPIKIIYPYFFPGETKGKSLVSRKEILIQLLESVPKEYLKSWCKLQNFPPTASLEKIFLSVQK